MMANTNSTREVHMTKSKAIAILCGMRTMATDFQIEALEMAIVLLERARDDSGTDEWERDTTSTLGHRRWWR
jgi:hypothetical protein